MRCSPVLCKLHCVILFYILQITLCDAHLYFINYIVYTLLYFANYIVWCSSCILQITLCDALLCFINYIVQYSSIFCKLYRAILFCTLQIESYNTLLRFRKSIVHCQNQYCFSKLCIFNIFSALMIILDLKVELTSF